MIRSDLVLPLTRARQHPSFGLPRRRTLDPSTEDSLEQSRLWPVMGVMKREPERNLCCSETLRVRGRLLQQQIRAFPDRYTVSCDSTNGITSGFWMFLIKMRVRENNAGDGNSGTEMGRRIFRPGQEATNRPAQPGVRYRRSCRWWEGC